MEIDQIKEMMAHIESSKIKKLHLKRGDFELLLEKEDHLASSSLPPHYHSQRAVSIDREAESMFHSEHSSKTAKSRLTEGKLDGKYVTSPMVGTFYASPSPDQPSFVKVGDQVVEDTVVCIIEAMKVMNEVKANVSGTVAEVLVESAHPVEFGSKIFRIE